jgi:hypothetical protein
MSTGAVSPSRRTTNAKNSSPEGNCPAFVFPSRESSKGKRWIQREDRSRRSDTTAPLQRTASVATLARVARRPGAASVGWRQFPPGISDSQAVESIGSLFSKAGNGDDPGLPDLLSQARDRLYPMGPAPNLRKGMNPFVVDRLRCQVAFACGIAWPPVHRE